MPVLDWEPALYPNDLLERAPPAEQTEAHRWWALHVRPRTEKAVARRLRFRSYAYYLPLREQRKTYQRRQVVSHVPLFPSYVFLCGDEDAHGFSTATREVVSCLEVIDQPRLVKDLRDVRRLLDSGRPVTPEEKLVAGMLARIVRGPLAGLSRNVIRNDRGLRFVLQVQFIQRAASIEVDGAMIEAI
jgi:transcriptional antiterminator RfaH